MGKVSEAGALQGKAKGTAFIHPQEEKALGRPNSTPFLPPMTNLLRRQSQALH